MVSIIINFPSFTSLCWKNSSTFQSSVMLPWASFTVKGIVKTSIKLVTGRITSQRPRFTDPNFHSFVVLMLTRVSRHLFSNTAQTHCHRGQEYMNENRIREQIDFSNFHVKKTWTHLFLKYILICSCSLIHCWQVLWYVQIIFFC